MVEQATNDRSECWAQGDSHARITNVLSTLCSSRQIRNDSTSERDRATASCGLKAPKNHESRVTILKCEANVCSQVNHERDDIGRSASIAIRETSQERWCQPLEYLTNVSIEMFRSEVVSQILYQVSRDGQIYQ